jgi:hypothetical protein
MRWIWIDKFVEFESGRRAVAVLEWPGLDARGNWTDFRESVTGQPDFKLAADPNGVNEYEQLTRQLGAPPGYYHVSTTQPVYDPAGNLLHDPLAPNLGGGSSKSATTPSGGGWRAATTPRRSPAASARRW